MMSEVVIVGDDTESGGALPSDIAYEVGLEVGAIAQEQEEVQEAVQEAVQTVELVQSEAEIQWQQINQRLDQMQMQIDNLQVDRAQVAEAAAAAEEVLAEEEQAEVEAEPVLEVEVPATAEKSEESTPPQSQTSSTARRKGPRFRFP